MGTNYYKATKKRNLGLHLGKRYNSDNGIGFLYSRYVLKLDLSNGIYDEYGKYYTKEEFYSNIIGKCKILDYRTVGQKFC